MLFLEWQIFHDVRITFFCGKFLLRMELMLQLRFVFFHHSDVFFIASQLLYLFFRCSCVFWWRKNYVLFWYVRITYGNNVSLLFVIVMHFLLRHNHVIYLFDAVSLFDDVRITLHLGTFELRTEIAL